MDDFQIDDDDAVLAEDGPLEIGGALVTQLEAPVLDSEQDLDALFGEDEDEEDLGEDDLELPEEPEAEHEHVHLDHAFEQEDERVAMLETAVKELAGDQVKRESKRVRRKVTAATGGAGLAGIAPIVLQLAGMLDMSPELASAIATIAAALGALLVGYLTPEREAPPSPAEILTAK